MKFYTFPITVICFFGLLNTTFAQPEPCDNPVMTPTCEEACIICDIDGFSGINDSNVQGTAPPGFCSQGIQNLTWIAFLAGSVDLSLDIAVSNCQSNTGLQMGIFEGENCGNFDAVTNCDNNVPPGSTVTLTNNQPLTIGQYYFLVIDGDLGDICNYSVNVVNGTTLVPPLPPLGDLIGPDVVCAEISTEYYIVPIPGAAQYSWTLDNDVIGDEPAIEIDWTIEGTFELCISASNVCDQPDPVCKTITVGDMPPTIYEETLCPGDCLEVADTTLCDAGNYEFGFTSELGCDSVVLVDLSYFPVAQLDLEYDICDGDSIFIAGVPYFETGVFQEVLTSTLGCDSTINLDLTVVICEIMGDITPTPTICFEEPTGMITFSVTDGTPPFDYNWEQFGGIPFGSGQVNNINEDVIITDLAVGQYIVTITDLFGNDRILLTEITQPTELEVNATFSNYNGFPVSCTGDTDGFISVSPFGGVPPYTYLWSDLSTDNQIQNIGAGFYTVTVTDFVGCELILAYQFIDPPPLVLAATFFDPTCDGFDTGSIIVDTAYGGVTPRLFDIGIGGAKTDKVFENLFGGEYTLTFTDGNGCTIDTTASLAEPQIPVITTNSPIDIDLGETASLEIYLNLIPDSIAWDSLPGLTCYDCENPLVIPLLDGLYPVSVWSEQGCVDTDTLVVRVTAIRRVYIPNIFSPNFDGKNDDFYISTGPEVAQINTLQVFDRWGETVFDGSNFPPNFDQLGWDGIFRGKPAPSGVYTYFAELTFIDGFVGFYEGDVTLIR